MTVVVEPEAQREWNQAVDWYEAAGPGLGLRFNSAIWEVIGSLRTQPDRFRLSGRLNRKAKVQGWPYSVFFVVNPAQQEVKVIAVWQKLPVWLTKLIGPEIVRKIEPS